jgi:hypothetical protein
MGGAQTKQRRSIARLHDDELSCVLPFLSLADLAQLVRCSRRFNCVARKEHSRGLHLEGEATIAPLSSSPLSHHVTSVRLHRRDKSRVFVSRQTLRHLKDCPRLTALDLTVSDYSDAAALMHERGPQLTKPQLDRPPLEYGAERTIQLWQEEVAEALQAVWPTQLRSFVLALGGALSPALCQVFCAVLPAPLMSELTALSILRSKESFELPPGILSQLLKLRTLTLANVNWTPDTLAEVKQLKQLREISLRPLKQRHIVALCEPPHSLSLQCIELPLTILDAADMRSLLHLPTLTSVEAASIRLDALALLCEFGLLQQLSFRHPGQGTLEWTVSLSVALSRCKALTDLSLRLSFDAAVTEEQRSACWTDILRSIPNVRRLDVSQLSVSALLSALPLHLPLLAHLSLQCGDKVDCDALLVQLAHPSVREFHLTTSRKAFSVKQLRALVRSSRLPQLDSISSSVEQ